MEKIIFEFYDAKDEAMTIAIGSPAYLKQMMTGTRHIAWILSVDISDKERYEMNGMNKDELHDAIDAIVEVNEINIQYVQ